MKAHASLCNCVDSPEPLLLAYTKYRCRSELRKLVPMRQRKINAGFYQYVISTNISLDKSSFEHFIYCIKQDQQLLFPSKCNNFYTFSTVIEQI